MSTVLTKSAFLQFLKCPREYWLVHHEPALRDGERTVVDNHRREEGYLFQKYACRLKRFEQTPGQRVEMERRFESEGLSAKSDIVITDLATGAASIFEVKSSTKVKPEHYYDVAFQKIAAEAAGAVVTSLYVVICNNKYVRNGEIDVEQLCDVVDVTGKVLEMQIEILGLIDAAFAFLSRPEPEPNIWDYCGDKLDCGFISHHFPDRAPYTVFEVSNLTRERRDALLKENVLDIRNIPDDFSLTPRQRRQVAVARSGQPDFDLDEIRTKLGSFEYPVHFLDYETFGSVIPGHDGFRPYQPMTFQYSLHTIPHPGGEVIHSEYLSSTGNDEMREMARHLREAMAEGIGTVVVWSDSYEMGRNAEMAARHPEVAEFFEEINSRTFDLRDIFSKRIYLHPGFRGRDSIKIVLPVLTSLSYEGMPIADGMTASIKWFHLVSGRLDEAERDTTRRHLLDYCKLDTLAMVEIFKFLQAL